MKLRFAFYSFYRTDDVIIVHAELLLRIKTMINLQRAFARRPKNHVLALSHRTFCDDTERSRTAEHSGELP